MTVVDAKRPKYDVLVPKKPITLRAKYSAEEVDADAQRIAEKWEGFLLYHPGAGWRVPLALTTTDGLPRAAYAGIVQSSMPDVTGAYAWGVVCRELPQSRRTNGYGIAVMRRLEALDRVQWRGHGPDGEPLPDWGVE